MGRRRSGAGLTAAGLALLAVGCAHRVTATARLHVVVAAHGSLAHAGAGQRARAVGDPSLREGSLGWPVAGTLSSPFGARDGRPHEGVDLLVPDGTPVHAAADGKVIYAGARLRGYGNLVLVDHGRLADPRGGGAEGAPHVVTVYAHNERLLVVEGQRVRRGDVIARSGHTGRASAPHCHFEVRVDGVPRDPLPWLPAALAR